MVKKFLSLRAFLAIFLGIVLSSSLCAILQDAGEESVASFGYDIFRADAEPIVEGPVDEQYILSSGDEVVISIWGQLNLTYNLTVSEEGFFELPDGGGRIQTNGVALKELRPRVVQALSQNFAAYINAVDPAKSTAFVDIKLAKVRKLLIYVVGEVKKPGAYYVSSGMATVINLLGNAGGVQERGSLREIRVRRIDGRIDIVDLYDFLVSGKIDYRKMRLQAGDYIIVPLKQKSVAVRGEIRRPSNYEIIGSEGIKELIRFAGGFTANASLKRIQVRRFEINAGEVFLDVDLNSLLADAKKNFALWDRDSVSIMPNIQIRKNVVSIGGEGIVRAGDFEWKPGMTLNDLVQKGEGLREYVYLDRADLIRTENDFSKKLTTFSLKELYQEVKPGVFRFSGNTQKNFVLRELDEILIYSAFRMAGKDRYVMLEGHVKEPGRYVLAKSMSLYDLVFSRGGFQDAAFLNTAFLDLAHIIRKVPGTIGEQIIPFNLGALLAKDPAANIPIQVNDIVRIYSFEQLAMKRQVSIGGLVKNPGAYPMAENLTLEDLIVLAGGLRPDAYKVEAVIGRTETQIDAQGKPNRGVATIVAPVEAGFASQPAENKTLLKAFDKITIRTVLGWEPIATVNLVGEVLYPGNFSLLRADETISSLIKRAGGLKKEALPQGAIVTRNRNILTMAFGDAPQNYEITINLEKALKDPNGPYDIVLKNGDRIFIPTNPGTVEIRGAVNKPLIVQHRQGWKMDDYINLCGGLLAEADAANIVVFSANNTATKVRRGLFRSMPEVTPGSVIDVPFRGQSLRLETVEVRGAVVKPVVIQHIPGQALGYYLNLCGGLRPDADADKIVVHLADGRILAKKDNQAFNPVLTPGSTVVIAARFAEAIPAAVDVAAAGQAEVLSKPETVEIKGAVSKPAVMDWQEAMRLDYYLGLCGGLGAEADSEKIVVRLPDGSLLSPGEGRPFNPVLVPGSVVEVPLKIKPERR